MSISINTNLSSMKSQRALWNSNYATQSAAKKLSSGVRINSASDDAANLTLSKKLDYKTSGLDVANKNINIGIGKLQTFDGYLGTMASSFQKMRDIAVQAANGTYSADERKMLNDSVEEMMKEAEISASAANKEIGAKVTNTSGLINEITQLTEAEIAAQYDEGHTIRSAAEFVSKISADLTGDFILANDIDMSELGTLNNSAITGNFQGEFDGNGNAIKNLTIDTGGAVIDNIGLFSVASGSTIENTVVQDVSIVASGSERIGGLVGYNNTNSTINNAYVLGSVSGKEALGGLVGLNSSNSTVKNSYSEVSIAGDERVGGLVGANYNNSTISNSYATGNVSGVNFIGGLAGNNHDGSVITNSYAIGSVSGDSRIGGLVGVNRENAIVENSYSTGGVSGTSYIGGLVGNNYISATVTNSYSTSNVSGDERVGGLVGMNVDNSNIDNSYSTGSVSGTTYIGGFVGRSENNSTVTNSYTTSSVQGSTNVGGFIGSNVTGSTTDDTNFYDNNMTADGAGSTATTDKTVATQNWDNSIWSNIEGEPFLKWQRGENDFSVQIGSENDSSSSYDMNHLALNFSEIGGFNLDLSSTKGASQAIETIDKAIEYISSQRSDAGSALNALEAMSRSNVNRSQHLQKTNSTIRDTDMALEAASMAKQQILQQSSTALLQQAQQLQAQSVLAFY